MSGETDFLTGPNGRSDARIPRALVATVALVVLFGLGLGAVGLITEWLWFDSLGLTSVFITSTVTRFALFLAAALLFLALFVVNIVTARRLAYKLDSQAQREPPNAAWGDFLAHFATGEAARQVDPRTVNALVLTTGLLLSITFGLASAGNWVAVLQFLNRGTFGIADPAFGQDVGFYLFVMPVLEGVEAWLFGAWALISLSTVAVYVVVSSFDLSVKLEPLRLPLGIRGHLLCLAAIGFLLIGAYHVLDMFDLVRSTRGTAFGASYTEVNAQRPAQLILAAFALLASGLCFVTIGRERSRLAVAGATAWAMVLVSVGWGYPIIVQHLVVKPNELERELPYIDATIRFTRHAFGLDGIEQRDVAFQEAVHPDALDGGRDTVNNIRLWDPRPLLDTYRQIQAIRLYYEFDDVDVDRYVINGEYRQVMVAARELVASQLPRQAQSWVSQQLQYTHGYGVAMTRVNVIGQEGLPDLAVRDVPPVGEVPVTRPEIYFGQRTDHYVITRTSTPEFDYPGGDTGVFVSRYGGEGGIGVGSLARRLLFAVRLQDPNFLLNTSFQEDSQLLYRRNIAQRAREVAPFLHLDEDPYIVVADGALYWIQDAYTVSDRYPYSEPYQPGGRQGLRRALPVNYIRNAVKIVTNAYDGTIRFYVTDPTDPVVQTYERIFPALFTPLEKAPDAIRAHFRFPEGLFRMQTGKYRLFHIEDPRVFYLREDQWEIPNELFTGAKQPVEPYYIIMSLPGDVQAEFTLMLPFTPSNRDNMIGWLAARSDGPNYGKMVVFKYPKDTLVYGPLQIETRIDQDPAISAQFSLWNQAGSQVIRGNLLTIPIGQSALYVEPIYLQATASPLPELKRVVVSTGNRVVMEATLGEALDRLFGRAAFAPTQFSLRGVLPTDGSLPVDVTVSQLAIQAETYYQRAQEALRDWDFVRFGDELRGLESILRQLVQTTNP